MRKRRIIFSVAGIATAFVCALLYTRFRAELSMDLNYQASPERSPAEAAPPAPAPERRDARIEPQADRAPAQVAQQVEPLPSYLIPPTTIHYQSTLPVLETVSSATGAPGRDGSYLRTRIVRAKFKYPLVRIEERLSAEGERVAEREMVADHVLVQLQEGASSDDLREVLARQGRFTAYIRKVSRSPGLVLVGFDGTDPSTMSQVMQSLASETHVVANSEPDYIVHAN